MKYACDTPKCSMQGIPFDTAGKCPRCDKPRKQAEVLDPNLDIRGDRIEPDPVKDSTKLCFYKALARAQCTDPKATWAEIIKETFPLRSHYRVAFDEDAWGPVLAEFYGFATVKSGVAHAKVLDECKDWFGKNLARTQKNPVAQFFVIAREDATNGVNGHAIYVEVTKELAQVLDNENALQKDKIAFKFNKSLFDIYGRTGNEALASRGEGFEAKKGRISEENIAELARLEKNKT